jgi:predicted nucleic acid-binding protein
MIRIVLDNNIVIDAFRPNPDFTPVANEVFRLIGDDDVVPYVCASSLTDIYYVLRKTHSANITKTIIEHLCSAFYVISVTATDCSAALRMKMEDFEDALIAVCAKKIGADYIISRDKEFQNADSGVNVISATELLRVIN